QADRPHAGGGEIKRNRAAEAAGADAQHFGIQQPDLTLHANFRQDQMAFVAVDLVIGQLRDCGHKETIRAARHKNKSLVFPPVNEYSRLRLTLWQEKFYTLTDGELLQASMQLISCHNGRLLTSTRDESVATERTFVTDLPALDELAPRGRL